MPQLTLYRDGLANLNGDATRTLPAGADSLLLLPPAGPRRRWLLLPASAGVEGEIRLIGRADRGNLRFRAPALAVALFAALPDSQQSISLRLYTSGAGRGWQLVA